MGKEDEDQFLGNLPGGVHRGDVFFGKRTIESRGAEWAARRRAETFEEKADLLIISNKDSDYLSFPYLRLGEEPQMPKFHIPRVNPVKGSILTARVVKRSFEELDSVDSSIYLAFGGKKFEPADRFSPLPQSLARSWKVLQIIPQEVDEGIEAAMRQADEIRWDYGSKTGVEQRRVETVLGGIQQLAQLFAQGEIKTAAELEQLAQESDLLLGGEGLLSASGQNWKNIVERMTKAARRDSMDRLNPMVSRIRARSALLVAAEREVVNFQVENKWDSVFNYLNVIRSGTRTRIMTSMEDLDQVAGLNEHFGVEIFREGYRNVDLKDANPISQIIKEVGSNLRGIQAAPYLPRVRLAQTALTGSYFMSNREEDTHRRVLEYAGYDPKALLSVPSAEEHLRHGRARKAHQMIEIAYEELVGVLDETKDLSYTVFTDQ